MLKFHNVHIGQKHFYICVKSDKMSGEGKNKVLMQGTKCDESKEM